MLTPIELIHLLWDKGGQTRTAAERRSEETHLSLALASDSLARVDAALGAIEESLKNAPVRAANGDEDLRKQLEKRLEKEGWLSNIDNLRRSTHRARIKAETPVTGGVMGRMGVGKTTILNLLLPADDNDPPRHVPARPAETTACAIRWVDAAADGRRDVARGRIALSLWPEMDQRATSHTVEIDGENVIGGRTPESWLGLEVTAHPPSENSKNKLWLETRGGLGIVRRGGSQTAGDRSLEEIARRSRQAIIPTKSRIVPGTCNRLLQFLDIMDFPGADAPKRADVRDKAAKVFEHCVHECDMLLMICGSAADQLNLGDQVWQSWTRWALRCTLGAPDSCRDVLVYRLIDAYAGEIEELAAVIGERPSDFVEVSPDRIFQVLRLKFEDSDYFWAWLEERKSSVPSILFDRFEAHIRAILLTTDELSSASLEEGRVIFVVNYGLAAIGKGFTLGPGNTFPDAYLGTTLLPLLQEKSLLASGWWPRFVFVDKPDPERDSLLRYESDPQRAFEALARLYLPDYPSPLDNSWEPRVAEWWRLYNGEILKVDEQRELVRDAMSRERDARRLVQGDKVLTLIHDFAQAWWWNDTFVRLSDERRREIYNWSLAVALGLVHRNARLGFDTLSTILYHQALGLPLDRHREEVERSLNRAQNRAFSLWEEICEVDRAGRAQLEEVKVLQQEVRNWGSTSDEGALALDDRIERVIESSRGVIPSEFSRRLRGAVVEAALAQAAAREDSDREPSEDLRRLVMTVIDRDPVLAAIEATQFLYGTQRDDTSHEVARAALIRVSLVLQWLRRGTDEDLQRGVDVLATQSGDSLLPGLKRAIVSELKERELGSIAEWDIAMGGQQ